MLAAERLLQIQEALGEYLTGIAVLDLEGETLRIVLYLEDGTNLRVTEQWEGEQLKRYSYYWLTALNELKIGWDNAAHHDSIETTPHHKHVKQQACVRSSNEHSLDAVMRVVLRSPWQEDDA